jgi:phenylacetate-CoA ligase
MSLRQTLKSNFTGTFGARSTRSSSAKRTSPPGFEKALALFHSATRSVPAYRDFIVGQNGIRPKDIQTPEDFARIPEMTKENYLKRYPLAEMLWNGDLATARFISMSSGSSGKPSSWPRGEISLRDSIELLRPIYTSSFHTDEKTTLCIIAFAMGTWIGGTYVLGASLALGEQGHKITCVTPGINRDEIINILQTVAPQYQQVIIAGYPPFIKDVMDEALFQGVNLGALAVKFLLAGENISERMRSYLLAHSQNEGCLDACICLYGTADAGIMGNETPFSVLVRQRASEDPDLLDRLFPGAALLPTLVEYDPDLRYCEVNADNYLLFTIQTELPLIRYNLLDKGRLPAAEEMLSVLPSTDFPLQSGTARYQAHPHIALYGRSDVAAMFYALNIYPENIKYGIEDECFSHLVTGKFLVETPYDEATQEQSFHIRLELPRDIQGVSDKEAQALSESVVNTLRKHNSEYNKLHKEIGQKALPILHFLPHGSPEFTIKIKHRWTIKP